MLCSKCWLLLISSEIIKRGFCSLRAFIIYSISRENISFSGSKLDIITEIYQNEMEYD